MTENSGEMVTKPAEKPESGISESQSSPVYKLVKRQVTFLSASPRNKEKQTKMATISSSVEGISAVKTTTECHTVYQHNKLH